MTTFYLDLEGGNDANDGTTFANRWKTFTNGATAARTAPGDTIRVMGSPAPTSLGNATWTLAARSKYVQIIGSSTNTTPISVTLNSHGLVNGDTVLIQSHTTNTNANGMWTVSNVSTNTFDLLNADGTNSVGNGVGGASGSLMKISGSVVTLANEVTKNIACFGNSGSAARVAWTAATANITSTISAASPAKESMFYNTIASNATFTTGKAAYFATGTLNLSTYQQLSFWFMQTVGAAITAGELSIRLCSDTLGDVPVNTFSIPAQTGISQWRPVTIDLATNLGSSIQSIALYINVDNGAKTFAFNNFIVCKAASSADSLTLTSLISKNTAGEAWYSIQSINSKRIIMDGYNNLVSSSPPFAYTASGTVTTYKRETIKTPQAAAASDQIATTNEAGTAGNLISFSGGWDRTNMSSQTGETWLDGINGFGYAFTIGHNYIGLDKVNFVRYYRSIYDPYAAVNVNIGSINVVSSNYPIDINGARWTIQDLCVVNSNNAVFIRSKHTVNNVSHIDGCTMSSSTLYALTSTLSCRFSNIGSVSFNACNGINTGTEGVFDTVTVYGNSFNGYSPDLRSRTYNLISMNNGYGISTLGDGAVISGGYTQGNITSAITNSVNYLYLKNYTLNETSEMYTTNDYSSRFVYSHNHDGTAGYHKIFWSFGVTEYQTTIKHGASNGAWKLSPTSSTSCVQDFPMPLRLALVACTANNLVTIKAWVRRTNTGLTVSLVALGGYIAGVVSNVSSSMTAAADTWEELTITFTPTETSAIPIELQCYGGSTYSAYVCDMTISQA